VIRWHARRRGVDVRVRTRPVVRRVRQRTIACNRSRTAVRWRPEVRGKVPHDSPDRNWSKRCIAGDESALRDAYREHAPAVLGLATRVLRDETLAEDVVQEVFVRLWERPEQFDPGRGRLRTYLLAMTHSRAVERLRAEDSQRRRAEAARREPVDVTEPDLGRALAVHEAGSAVRRALNDLPAEQRIAIEMAYFDGYSYREVAVVLAAPEGTVRSRIRSGMQKMRAALQAAEVSP
jgi:RNA polymerase sigma-70 factor (ECF subfamily)